MKKMNFKEFENKVMANIKDYLTEDYKDFDMKFTTVKKSSGVEYEALMVGPKDKHMSVVPALNMNEAYKQYSDGMDFEDVMKKLADIRMNATLPNFKREDMFDYEKVQDRIFPRLINTAANTEYLADKPHKEIEDLSLIYAVRVFEDEDGFGEAVITDDLVHMWGATAQDIHEHAMDNIAQRPPLFQNIETVLFGEPETLEIEDVEPEEYNLPFFVLTNQQKTKGAVMAVNPKAMGRITAKLGDVYVIPSSVDETLIVPKSAVDDVQKLVDIVTNVNSHEVRPEDQLSNNVYEYDSVTQTLKIASVTQTQSDAPEETPDETVDKTQDM